MRALGRLRHWLHEVDVNEGKLDSFVGIRWCLILGLSLMRAPQVGIDGRSNPMLLLDLWSCHGSQICA